MHGMLNLNMPSGLSPHTVWAWWCEPARLTGPALLALPPHTRSLSDLGLFCTLILRLEYLPALCAHLPAPHPLTPTSSNASLSPWVGQASWVLLS